MSTQDVHGCGSLLSNVLSRQAGNDAAQLCSAVSQHTLLCANRKTYMIYFPFALGRQGDRDDDKIER